MSSSRLPEELIIEILIRSPAKTLLRFRSTCKDWKRLISSLTFAKSHQNNLSVTANPPLPSFLLSKSDSKVFSVDFQPNYETDQEKGKFRPCYIPEGGKSRPLASCHGIICMIRTIDDRDSDRDTEMYLWNPVLNQSQEIGYPSITIRNHKICGCGFGYISSIDGYKIVLLVKEERWYYNRDPIEPILLQIHVYCTSYKRWRALDVDNNTIRFPLDDLRNNPSDWGLDSVLYNESVCWIVGRDLSYFILKFDLKNEVFDKVEIPKLKSKDYDEKQLRTDATIGVTQDNNLCIGLNFTVWRYDGRRANIPSCVQMWQLRQGRWEKCKRVPGDWKYLGDNHELLGLGISPEYT